MQEYTLVLQHLTRHAEAHSDSIATTYLRQKLQEMAQRAELVRQAAIGHQQLDADAVSPEPS
jgi:hypothetical protein